MIILIFRLFHILGPVAVLLFHALMNILYLRHTAAYPVFLSLTRGKMFHENQGPDG